MPTKKPLEMKKEAAPPTPAVQATPEKFSGFAEKWREAVDSRLTGYLKDFVKDAMPEEKAFMIEVLSTWESRHGRPIRGFQEHDLPLLSAISLELNGDLLVPVESEEMMLAVEAFITETLASGRKLPKREYVCNLPAEDGDARIRRLLLRHVDYFTHECRREDMNFLSDVLEQWEAIVNNKGLRDGTPHHMAAAAEIHLELLRRNGRRWGTA